MKILRLVVGMVQTNCYIFYDRNTMEGAVVDPGDNAKKHFEGDRGMRRSRSNMCC